MRLPLAKTVQAFNEQFGEMLLTNLNHTKI